MTAITMNTKPKLKRFTVEDYYCMLDNGILNSQDRVELIHGKIIEMTPIGSRHAGYVNLFNNLLAQKLNDKVAIAIQNPVRLSQYSEPEPDIAVLKPRADFYTQNHPTPEDVLLLIEVADTSVGYDYDEKLPMYAAAGIPEVWILDINQQQITQHSQADGNEYLDENVFKKGMLLKSKQLDFELEVGKILIGEN